MTSIPFPDQDSEALTERGGTMTYIKILDADGRSVHGGNYQWPLPKQRKNGKWTPGAWVEVDGKIEPCANGLHATDEAHLWTWLKNVAWRTWELEYAGDVIDANNKVVGRKARLLRPFTLPMWWMSVDGALAALKDTPWFVNDGTPDPTWKIFGTRDAARDAAWDAAWDAADHIIFTTICADLPIEQKHRDEIARRWRVWQKGYGLAAEIGGVLYVYKSVN